MSGNCVAAEGSGWPELSLMEASDYALAVHGGFPGAYGKTAKTVKGERG